MKCKTISCWDMLPQWEFDIKKDGNEMTRIAAASDGKEIIVGADTLLTNTIDGKKTYVHKLYMNNSGTIVALMSGIEFFLIEEMQFFTKKYKVSIVPYIEEALEKTIDVTETIGLLEKYLTDLYKRYNLKNLVTQIIVFYKESDGYATQLFQIKYNSDCTSYMQNFGKMNINNKLFSTGYGIDSVFFLKDIKYDGKLVKKNIESAITDEEMEYIGGTFEYIKISKDGKIEKNF